MKVEKHRGACLGPDVEGWELTDKTPEQEAKRRHPFVYGLIVGLLGALGAVALIVQVAIGIPELLEKLGVRDGDSQPNVPAEFDTLARTEIAVLADNLASGIFARLRREDGSIEPYLDQQLSRSENWSSASVLSSILACPVRTVEKHKHGIENSLRFLEGSFRPNTGGWQINKDEGSSFVVATSWATIAMARYATYPGVWSVREREWAVELCERGVTELLRFYDEDTGGFTSFYPTDKSAEYSYNAMMAVYTLLETRAALGANTPEVDEAIRASISWLLRQRDSTDNRCRFKHSSEHRQAVEPIGLTAQVLYTLERARRAGYESGILVCEQKFLTEMLSAELSPLWESGFSIEAERFEEEGEHTIRTMWYPWTLLWVSLRLEEPSELSRHELESLRDRLLDRTVVDTLVRSFETDETWRIAETLTAFGAVAGRE